MLRTTISKIKRVCSIAFIPRILQGNVKYAPPKKFTKHSMSSSQATKSTSSNSGSSDNNKTNNIEEKSHDNVQKFNEENVAEERENVQKYNEKLIEEERERRNRLINKIFPPGDPLYATSPDKEGLEQKLEQLKEIEAGVTTLLEEQKDRDTTNLYFDADSNKYDTRYDAIANRCLTTPTRRVDEHILKELGVDNIPENIDLFPQRPTQSYYSEVLYGKPQVIRYKKEESKSNELQKVSCISDLHVENIYKAELIQPLILDSISLCECIDKGSESDNFDALEDSRLSPVVMDPYAHQAFPFHNYGIEEDIMLENPIEEESINITTGVDDVSNNNLIPPTEMEIEGDQGHFRENVEGAVTGLAGPNETSINAFSAMAENGNGIFYTQPTSGPPGEGPGTLHRQPDKVVKPKTAISSKNKEEKQSNPTSTSISDNQNPNDSDNINRFSSAQERSEFLLNMPANVFTGNASIAEDIQEPIFARKTIVSYIEGSYRRPVIEIKIPVYNLKETEQSIEQATVNFKEADGSLTQNSSDRPNQSGVKAPNKTPEMHKLERTVSHIEVCEKSPHLEKPVLNVRLKPEYEGLLNKQVSQTDSPNLTATGPIPSVVQGEAVTLNELLRRIRERHRLELCRDYYNQLSSVPSTLAENPCKGKDKSPCPPPPKCPTTTQKDPCAPKKDPCAPKKDPCKRKDPCAKFTNTKIFDTLSLLRVYFLSDFRSVNYQHRYYSSQVVSTGLEFRAMNTLERSSTEKDIALARDYEPWIPIPSWPTPRKEKRRPFVCPKDGCKLLPSPPFDPAFKDKPCVSFPKKKFCLSELFEHPVLNHRES